MNLQQLNKPITLPSFKLSAKKMDSKPPVLKIALSLDIGSRYTKLLVGGQKANRLAIEQTLMTRTPEGACADGAVTDSVRLGAMLKGLIAQDKTATKDLVFSVESTKIIKREFIVPKISENDILGLVTFEMGQYLPIDISEYSVQPKVIGGVKEGGDEKIKVCVNAVPKGIIQAYQKLFTSVGLRPVSMDINPNSIEKLIRFEMKNNPANEFADKNVVFIDMGHSCFNMSVYENGMYQFSRDIEIGGYMIDDMIEKALDVDPEKANQIKKEVCSRINAVDLDMKYGRALSGYHPQNINETVLIELLYIMNNWAGQVDNVLQYIARSLERNIDRIYIYGGSSSINGIGDFFEKKLSVKTSAANTFKCCEYGAHDDAHGIMATHLNTLGALLRL